MLETLLIIAYLCIALISIVIAVYAIGVSYQGRETQRSKWRKKKRREELKRKIKELGPKADIEGIREKINRYDKEITEIDSKLFYLSIWGTVIFPIACFLFALIAIAINIYADPTGTMKIFASQDELLIRDLLTGGAILAIVVGVGLLIKTLFAVEWAASRIPVPKFEINFEKGIRRIKCESKEKKHITLCLGNKGEDIAENLQIFVFFKPSFTVHKKVEYSVVKQGIETDYLDYNAAIFWIDFLHIDTTLYLRINLTMPEKEDIYEIPVTIYERKTGAHKDKLIIEIVE